MHITINYHDIVHKAQILFDVLSWAHITAITSNKIKIYMHNSLMFMHTGGSIEDSNKF